MKENEDITLIIGDKKYTIYDRREKITNIIEKYNKIIRRITSIFFPIKEKKEALTYMEKVCEHYDLDYEYIKEYLEKEAKKDILKLKIVKPCGCNFVSGKEMSDNELEDKNICKHCGQEYENDFWKKFYKNI